MKTPIPLFLIIFHSPALLFCQNRVVVPPPDGGYPGGNTAKGIRPVSKHQRAGLYNTAIGCILAPSITDGDLCTAVGAGPFANTAPENTAIGGRA
jgi:hypothetical protein